MTMMERPRDIVGGLLVAGIGAAFFVFAQELEMGTSFRMGPGYFPTILSWLMIALGVAMVGLGLRAARQEGAFGHVPWRGLILIVGSTILFGLTLRGLGLIPIVFLVVFACAWASHYGSWRGSLPLSLGVALFCAGLFVKLLGLPLPLVGPWLSPAYWSPPAAAPAAPAESAGAPTAPAESPAQ